MFVLANTCWWHDGHNERLYLLSRDRQRGLCCCDWRCGVAGMRKSGLSQNDEEIYRGGRKARDLNMSIDSNPYQYAEIGKRMLWAAGFNDRDAELRA